MTLSLTTLVLLLGIAFILGLLSPLLFILYHVWHTKI